MAFSQGEIRVQGSGFRLISTLEAGKDGKYSASRSRATWNLEDKCCQDFGILQSFCILENELQS